MSMEIEILALQRIAAVFDTPVEQLRPEWVFGGDLKSSSRSDFARNEFDAINDDVHDVADSGVLRLLDEGQLFISTVSEYCEFMVKMGGKNAKAVVDVLMSHNGFVRNLPLSVCWMRQSIGG